MTRLPPAAAILLLLALAAPAGAQTVPPAPADGGPRHWEVTGVTTTLNLRAGPTTTAEVLDRLPVGTILSNLGCTGNGGRVWCDVERIAGGPRGFVDAGYLTPAVAPNGAVMTGPDDSALRAGLGEFDATGTIPCAWEEGQPMGQCDFGVARAGGGDATVVVTRADGTTRTIVFTRGQPLATDAPEADMPLAVTRDSDLTLLGVGPERYEIPDAAIFGG